MLVLARKRGETIQIGDSTIVKVLRVEGGRVKLGIEAPAEVRVRRGELEEQPAAALISEVENWTPVSVTTQSAV